MIIVNKRFIRIVDHLEKEVQIYDTINEKKIFNIFFELDSAICLNGALTDTVDLLNDLSEENEQLKQSINQLKIQNSRFMQEVAEYSRKSKELEKENEQLKQFPVKLNNRIQKLEESLKALKEMETDDLNPQAVEDVAIVIEMSLNALMEFRKELKGDVK